MFTRHLAKELLTEGIEVEQMFKNVRVKAIRDTNQRQVPRGQYVDDRELLFNPPRGANRDDAAKQTQIAKLQELLDRREQEQRRLEERLRHRQQRLRESARLAPEREQRVQEHDLPRPSAAHIEAAADFRGLLPRLDVPLLVVLGSRSAHYAGVPLDAYYREAVPHARVLRYARSGHSPHYAEPARFARDLAAFVAEHWH